MPGVLQAITFVLIHNNFVRVLGQKNKTSQILNSYNSVQTIEKATKYTLQFFKGSFITSKSIVEALPRDPIHFDLINTHKR